MHDEAFRWVARAAAALPPRLRVCELGSRDVNGSVRPLFPGADPYLGIDAAPGHGVDVVADAATWRPPEGQLFDAVVCTEVLEHTPDGAAICRTAWDVLAPGGVFLVTAAAPTRSPHSAADGGPLRPGEFYRNVDEPTLRQWLAEFRVDALEVFPGRGDIYALAVKPE